MRVLLIEDDAGVAGFIAKGLTESGHVVDQCADGRTGLEAATVGSFDVLVVDRMLPGLDGLTLVKQLRDGGQGTPVLFLSALGEVDHRVEGLQAGGDDYLTKPFAFSELLARLEALARRHRQEPAATELRVGDLTLNLLSREVHRGGVEITLQNREFQLLEYLMRHAGQVVTRTMLLEKVWNYHFDPQTNVIDVHISRLRQKIDRAPEPSLIRTVRGAGYSLRSSE